MTDKERVATEEQDVAERAQEACCDAVLVLNEDDNRPGTWHFSQRFDEGRVTTKTNILLQ
jgi:hypothetical protein